VVVPHRVPARVVRRLVHGEQDVRVATDVRGVVVPLVRARPAAVEMPGGGVHAVLDDHLTGLARAGAGGRVPGHQRAYEVVPPLEVPAHVGRVVDRGDALAGALERLERLLLARAGPRVARRLEHHDRVVLREVGVVEDGRVLGDVGRDPGGLQRGDDLRRALLDRLGVPERRRLGEDQDVARLRGRGELVERRGGRGREVLRLRGAGREQADGDEHRHRHQLDDRTCTTHARPLPTRSARRTRRRPDPSARDRIRPFVACQAKVARREEQAAKICGPPVRTARRRRTASCRARRR
jgi:hypothetical protein